MNYLAHAVLAGDDPDWVIGAFLGDHVRGEQWRDYPAGQAAGIRYHRALDVAFDRHSEVVEARAGFGTARRYAGILIDLGLDHVLARDWADRSGCAEDLTAFAQRCLDLMDREAASLPPSLERFISYARATNQLVAYRTHEGVDLALRGLATRMRRPGPLAEGWEALAPHLPVIEALADSAWVAFQSRAASLREEIA